MGQVRHGSAKTTHATAPRLRDVANERRRFSYRRSFVLLRREGGASGINRIYRLYNEEGLTVRKRKARRKAISSKAPMLREARAKARGSLDFASRTCGSSTNSSPAGGASWC